MHPIPTIFCKWQWVCIGVKFVKTRIFYVQSWQIVQNQCCKTNWVCSLILIMISLSCEAHMTFREKTMHSLIPLNVIDLFTNVSPIYGCFFLLDLVAIHFTNLYLIMEFQYLESTLHSLVIATSDIPRTSCQVVRNNLFLNGMHNMSEPVYFLPSSRL